MKVYQTDKAITKLQTMLLSGKGDTICARKKKDNDRPENIFQGIKLSEEHRKKHKTGESYSIYINKERLSQIKTIIQEKPEEYKDVLIRKGAILPLIPLILAGIGATSGVAGAASGIAKVVIDKKAEENKLKEEQRHNTEMEKVARGEGMFLTPWKNYGMDIGVKDFINSSCSGLDDISKKSFKEIIKHLSSHFKIEKQGDGLYLSYPH